MDGAYDASKVETAVVRLEGVNKASADYATRRLTIDYGKTKVGFSDFERVIYTANITQEYSINIYVFDRNLCWY